MERPSTRVDKHGFPIPATFDDVPYPSDPVGNHHGRGRWVLFWGFTLLVLAGVGAIYGPPLVAWAFLNRAIQLEEAGEYDSALENLDQAIGWDPNSIRAHLLRSVIREAQHDLEGALLDIDQVVRMLPLDQGGSVRRITLAQRAKILQRLALQKPAEAEALHRRALVDINEYVELQIKLDEERLARHQRRIADDPRRIHDPQPLPSAEPFNARAYYRAIAGVELNEALDDVNTALKINQRQMFMGRTQRSLEELQIERAMFLDTRGYVHYQLANYKQGLEDMEKALKIVSESNAVLFGQREFQRHQANLAVMHQHRGLILEKLGRKEEAQRDFDLARQLGFDPQNGVY